MKNTTWRKRRLKKGLDMSEVANYLDISYERYALIDRGEVKMPNKYIEKFNELINKSKGETNINRLTREEIVNVWWDTMSQKVGHGRFKLNEKMIEFNIQTLNELDILLGYKHKSGMMSNYLNGHQQVGFDVKNKVYSFFENELNIQPPKVKQPRTNNSARRTIQQTDEYVELLKWFNSFDFKKWRDDHKMTNKELHEASGLATGTIYNIIHRTHDKPTISVMQRLKNFIDNYTEKPVNKPISQVMTFTSIPAEEVPKDIRRMGEELVREVNENMSLKEKLLNKYEQELENLDAMIAHHEAALFDLRKEKEFYEKIINDINED